MSKGTLYTLLAFAAVSIYFIFFAKCRAGGEFTGREYMPDMTHSNAYESYSPGRSVLIGGDTVSLAGVGGSSARKPVAGTIPRGYVPYHYPDTPEAYEQAGQELFNPYNDRISEVAESGKKMYDINCAICHGAKGEGNGTIVANGKYPAPPPSYFIDRLLELPDGKMFHSVHYGKNLMGSYAAQLNKEERWKVISYIRKMQADFVAKNKKMKPEDALRLITGANSLKFKYASLAEGASAPAAATTAPADTAQANAASGIVFRESELDKIEKQPLKAGQIIALNNVFFDTNSFALRPESFQELDKLVSILSKNAQSKIELGGHTDNVGNAQKNMELSKNRAQAVLDYLVGKGVKKEQLTANGYGSSKPVAPNNNAEGRAKNRRTEFKVLN